MPDFVQRARFRWAVAAVLLLVGGCGDINSFRFYHANRAAPATWNAEPGLVRLAPGDQEGLVIPVKINGGNVLMFRLDTLAPVLVTGNEAILSEPGFRTAGPVSIGPEEAPTWSGRAVENIDLALGDLVLKEHAILLADVPPDDVDGLIGYDLLRRAVAEADADREVLRLHRPNSFRPSRTAAAVPLVLADRRPYVDVHVETSDGRGAYLRLGLALAEPDELVLGPAAASALGDGASPLALTLGGIRLQGLRARRGEHNDEAADGRLGLGALRGRRFAVDLPGAFLWIYPPEDDDPTRPGE